MSRSGRNQAALLEEVAAEPGSAGRAGVPQAEGGRVGSALRLPEPGDQGVGLVWGTEISQITRP